jgi:predicted glycoside hydrolase/deacetylase ChbG (UPF0249 family)
MIHADDIGMCHAANDGIKQALADGRVSSCSVMMPCPWTYDFCVWAKDHPEVDVGLHITLTSEWKRYKWRPVLPSGEVPSLCDRNGFLWPDVIPLAMRGKADEVEREIRAQVERALAWGLRPTHLDSHMGAVFTRPDFAQAFLKVAREFAITPFLMEPNPEFIALARKQAARLTPKLLRILRQFPSAKVDRFALPNVRRCKSDAERKAALMKQLRGLRPGITILYVHPCVDTPELRAVTPAAQMRVWELNVLADPDVRRLIEDQGIQVVSWRDLTKRRPMPKPTTTAAAGP